MSLKDFLGSLFKSTIINDVKESVKETMEDVEKRIVKITHNVVKSLVLVVMTLVGAIFALVGLGTYLNETVAGLAHGVGYIVVGAVIIILALFAKLMQDE
jgi:ABC-type antimicrobial peptide transport system permease subunit